MFHVKHAGDDESALTAQLPVSESVLNDLCVLKEFLSVENQKMNLVGPSALRQFWTRHALDSAQLLGLAGEARTFADIGAGAGFPGLVIAIQVKEVIGAHVHLVESQTKRCRFLEKVSSELGLPVTVHNRRAESFKPAPVVDIVTARACAPMARIFEFASPFMRLGATGLFLKGANALAELTEARKSWRFQAHLSPSLSNPDGRIVRVEALARG